MRTVIRLSVRAHECAWPFLRYALPVGVPFVYSLVHSLSSGSIRLCCQGRVFFVCAWSACVTGADHPIAAPFVFLCALLFWCGRFGIGEVHFERCASAARVNSVVQQLLCPFGYFHDATGNTAPSSNAAVVTRTRSFDLKSQMLLLRVAAFCALLVPSSNVEV